MEPLYLQPQEKFTIVRGLENHNDSTLYYIQAVITRAKDNVVVATLNLERQGSTNLYKKDWVSSADPSGLGLQLINTVTTYTDSGYSTKSPQHPELFYTYIVEDRRRHSNLGGGVSTGIDYARLQEVVEKAVDEKVGDIKATVNAIEATDLTPVMDAIQNVSEGIGSQIEDLPLHTEISFEPVKSAIEEAKTSILKGMPQSEKVDMRLFERLLGRVAIEMMKSFNSAITKRDDAMIRAFEKEISTIRTSVGMAPIEDDKKAKRLKRLRRNAGLMFSTKP